MGNRSRWLVAVSSLVVAGTLTAAMMTGCMSQAQAGSRPVAGQLLETATALVPAQLPAARLTPRQPPALATGCPVTPYTTGRPPEAQTAAFTRTWYGNAALWAGLAPPYHGQWYAGQQGLKVLWWRGVPGRLTVQGQRLDAPAPPLMAEIPAGYGVEGLQASGLIFPTAGCWSVTATAGSGVLRFVVNVHPAEEHPIKP